MTVPYIFSNVPGGTTIPLSELDANFLYITGGNPQFAALTLTGNLAVGGTTTVTGLTTLNGGLTLSGPFTINGITVSPTGTTGVGNLVFSNGPTLVAPILGTPASGNLSNCTGYSIGQVTGLATNVLPFLANPSSSNFAAAILDETGTGQVVFNNNPIINSPTLTTPVLGTPSSGNLSSCTAYSATALSGVVPIANGGTGLPSTGAIGQILGVTALNTLGYFNAPPTASIAGGAASQILYQSAPNTTSFIPNGTIGQPLVSNGAATPAWGQISLTSAITGILPVANGGTGLTSFGTGVAAALGNNINTPNGFTVFSASGLPGQVLMGAGAGVSPVWTATPVFGTVGSAAGVIGFAGATSGTITLSAPAVAGTATAILQSPTETVLTSGSGTYTTPANVQWIRVRMTAGGGGGGGTTGPSSGAGGGAAGAYLEKIISSPAASYAYTVGAGGAGGATASAGSAGSSSTFGGSLTCGGGNGGSPGSLLSTDAPGGLGTSASGGTINFNGNPGSKGFGASVAGGAQNGGDGGSSVFGGCGRGGLELAVGTPAQVNSGSGGGGAGGGGTFAGGNGGSGIIIIEEHYMY
jgi:hypothetical protein